MAKRRFEPPAVCPVCGEDVPPKALACPECGADEQSGWREDALTGDAIGLSDDEFDYDAFVAEEFGGKARKKSGREWFWWVVAVLVLLGMGWFVVTAWR